MIQDFLITASLWIHDKHEDCPPYAYYTLASEQSVNLCVPMLCIMLRIAMRNKQRCRVTLAIRGHYGFVSIIHRDLSKCARRAHIRMRGLPTAWMLTYHT